MNPILQIKNLRIRFEDGERSVQAVGGISLDLKPGETIAVVGESGSGKTITSLACLQLLPPQVMKNIQGEILFEGKNLLQANKEEIRKIRGRRIAMIFQDPMSSLNPFLTVERQMTEVLATHLNMPREDAQKKTIEALRQVGIPSPEKRLWFYPHQLSGGQRQRVMIAMALLCEPSILIADEPTTALDVTIQAQILELLKKIQKEKGMSMILISHDLGVVAGMAERIYVMYAGRILEQGKTVEVFEKPKNPYTLGLLRSLPRIDREGRLEAIPGNVPELGKLGAGCPFDTRCNLVRERCSKEFPPAVPISPTHLSFCFETERV